MIKRLNEASFQTEWLPCSALSVVWLESQRPFNKERERAAQAIVDAFDPDLFDALKVTKPNGVGQYHICDGQVRHKAIVSMFGPNEKVPCLVAPDGDPVRAAEIFLSTNTLRRSPSKVDNFKVSVTAQRRDAVAIDRIVKHNKYRVDGGNSHNAIAGVGALQFIFSVCGPSVLNETLQSLREIWGDDRNAVAAPMMRGFGVFLNEFGNKLNKQRFVDVIKKKWTPGALLRDAKATREVHGGSTTAAIVAILTTTYNRNLRGTTPLKRKEPKK